MRLGLLVPLLGVGVAAQEEGRLEADDPGLAAVLERLERVLAVARQERDPQQAADAVARGGGLHHDRVEGERLLGLRDAVVRHAQAALDAVLVHVLEVVADAREVVDDRLHGVVDAVERPRLDLADVAVPVDHVPLHSVRQRHGSPVVQIVRRLSRSASAAARHSSGSVNSRRGARGSCVVRLAGLGIERDPLDGVPGHHRVGVHQGRHGDRAAARERHLHAPVGGPHAPARPRSR